jgi:hypothetical protein
MVRAILAGTKTQTRRPVAPGGAPVHHDRTEGTWRCLPPHDDVWVYMVERDVRGGVVRCPFGVPGDRLWVREAFNVLVDLEPGKDVVVYRASCDADRFDYVHSDGTLSAIDVNRWKPSIHMPRWASRLTLRVTDVRVERVRDITEADAKAEGVGPATLRFDGPAREDFRVGFASLWSATYGPESWTANPWVWCVSFVKEASDV